MAVYPKSHTHNATSVKKLTILPQKKPKQIFCSGLSGCLNLGLWAGQPGGWQMQWRSRVSVELSAAARSFTPTGRAKVVAAGAGLATLVRSHRLRRPREEETSAPWSNRGLPLWRGLDSTLRCYGSLSARL